MEAVALEVSNPFNSSARLNEAADLAGAGRSREALSLVQALKDEVEAAGFESSSVYLALGVLFASEGEMERALIYAGSATDMEPNNPDFEEAFRLVVEQSNKLLADAAPWNQRGWVLFRLLASSNLATAAVVALASAAVDPLSLAAGTSSSVAQN